MAEFDMSTLVPLETVDIEQARLEMEMTQFAGGLVERLEKVERVDGRDEPRYAMATAETCFEAGALLHGMEPSERVAAVDICAEILGTMATQRMQAIMEGTEGVDELDVLHHYPVMQIISGAIAGLLQVRASAAAELADAA